MSASGASSEQGTGHEYLPLSWNDQKKKKKETPRIKHFDGAGSAKPILFYMSNFDHRK
jgi:hypothetical protein